MDDPTARTCAVPHPETWLPCYRDHGHDQWHLTCLDSGGLDAWFDDTPAPQPSRGQAASASG